MAGRIAERLRELGIALPAPQTPMGVYRPGRVSGGHLYVSGQGTRWDGETHYVGKVGRDFGIEEGARAARICGLNILAAANGALGGDLDRIAQVVKLLGFVNCTPEFGDQPKVINGCSELLVEVFGAEAGVGARSAIGAPALPGGIAVEIEAIFELHS